MYLIGFDIGSSSVKAAIVDAATKETLASVQYPEKEMAIEAPQVGWAEQDPVLWWKNLCIATKKALEIAAISPDSVLAIGISYQMHGLVTLDKDFNVLRPSIIWCDSRAVQIGQNAFAAIGEEKCLSRLLNSPGNFTASKLKWVRENEPDTYDKIAYFMLPGDYIALKLTGTPATTISGLSEGILWDFTKNDVAEIVLDQYGIDRSLIPPILPTFSEQGKLTSAAAAEIGLAPGIPVTYRAGDQPNNALSLDVLDPGEVAATGGTSGVVYGVVDQPNYDAQSRVNGFAHVNYTPTDPRIGILLCINGSGILYSWVKQNIGKEDYSYFEMEQLAEKVSIGSDGLSILPFGNGAERMLCNENLGAHFVNVQLNRHTHHHFYRAALEGIAFSFVYGMEILTEMGLNVGSMKVGNDNLFQSRIFSGTISTLVDAQIEVVETTGAVGAARAAGFGCGHFSTLREAMAGNKVLLTHQPDSGSQTAYRDAYHTWKTVLEKNLSGK